MKWSKRIAQVFRPGSSGPRDRPESIPNTAHAACNSELAQYSNTPSLRVAGFEDEDENEAPHERPNRGTVIKKGWDILGRAGRNIFVCRHLQGGSLGPHYPGLKPWAILLDHFMVKNQCAARTLLIISPNAFA
jgi:hypothetical protein